MKIRKLLALLLSAALLFSVVACSAPQGSGFPGTADADMVTLNINSEPTDLNPMRMSNTIDQSVLYHCMSGFTKLDGNDEPVADLAESWDINEDSTVYTMHLRKDAVWSNGDPVTAHDFYYSWVTQMTAATGTIYASFLYNNIKNGEAFYQEKAEASELGLKVIDDYTLEIQWSHPMTNGLFFLSQPFFLPINQKAYEEIGDQAYAKEANQMVTNGAYQITEWVHDDHLTMEKSETYFDAKEIDVPKVKLVMVGDANTSVNAFIAGEIDMTGMYSEQISLVEEVDKTAVQSYIDGGSWYLDFNTAHESLSNVNLRKALAYSVDVQSLLDHVINDGSIAADGLVPGTIAGVGEKSYAEARGSLFQFDKDAANDYLTTALQELGIEKSALNLVFWGTDSTYNQNQAAYLQQQWKENLGLDVELKAVANSALSEAKLNGDYTFTVGAWGPSENDAITFLENFQTGMMSNYGRYSNPEYDRLIQESMAEGNAQKRQDLLIQAEKLLINDLAIGPMYFTCSTYALSGKLVGLVRTPFQYFNVCGASLQK